MDIMIEQYDKYLSDLLRGPTAPEHGHFQKNVN